MANHPMRLLRSQMPTLLVLLVVIALCQLLGSASAQRCSLGDLQEHLATVQEQCCYGAGGNELAEHLVAYWNFEEGPDHRSAEDVTGNDHTAGWSNGRSGRDKWPDSDVAGGQYGMDFRHDGGDTLTISNHDGFPTGNSDRTFQVWFKKQDAGDMAFFQHGCWTTCQGWNWGMRDNGQWMHLDAHGCDSPCEFGNRGGDCNSVRAFTDIANPNDNRWHQAVISYRGSVNRFKAWYDGQPFNEHVGQRLQTCNTNSGDYGVRIGSNSWDPNGWTFNGQMDEVAYWDTVLTDDQVAALWNDGNGLDLSSGGAGQAECTSGYPAASDVCSRECARAIQPFWNECGDLLSEMGVRGTEGMEEFDAKCAARPTCDFALLFEHMQNMQDVCCSARESCVSGNPGVSDTCSMDCALIFEPFWDDCGAAIKATVGAQMGGMDGMTAFYNTCLVTRYPPGSCTDECSASTLHCRRMEVQNACCEAEDNCPDDAATPLRCPVGCALFFPSMVNDCESALSDAGLTDEEAEDYSSFSDLCLDQDAPALVEYAHDLVRQGCDIDLVPPRGRGRRAQDDEGPGQKTGIAKLLQTDPTTCSWDSFDDRIVEMSAVCCGTNADETCADGQPPRECSPECGVYFHSFYSDCEILLSTVQQDDFEVFTDFHEMCLEEADVSFFLNAIQHATCCSVNQCGSCDENACNQLVNQDGRACSWSSNDQICVSVAVVEFHFEDDSELDSFQWDPGTNQGSQGRGIRDGKIMIDAPDNTDGLYWLKTEFSEFTTLTMTAEFRSDSWFDGSPRIGMAWVSSDAWRPGSGPTSTAGGCCYWGPDHGYSFLQADPLDGDPNERCDTCPSIALNHDRIIAGTDDGYETHAEDTYLYTITLNPTSVEFTLEHPDGRSHTLEAQDTSYRNGYVGLQCGEANCQWSSLTITVI